MIQKIGQTNYHCYHLISLAVNLGKIVIPTQYIKVSIEPKAKFGRKNKAKSCLILLRYSDFTKNYVFLLDFTKKNKKH
ncbi:hypothetical protein BpHYR1_032217 [Brachionus plicatilis]|uniref:Uncharacterized protein n=1 Tax=Brachionus plicatilis TaxID=10195 RepID=A0A3M7R534_BRAPC|nr:hypothetical protein BpHYR1_032217 [Brachionus plicatilis]